ncbi:hypothetical protein [Saccharibacillus kuerlensis]|uniref:Tissue inhibitor of metalloproteinase n=1 Tax=Saccharibacillus kuerlensis TaxID=459527 RepID=A0ABQ2LA12_9BACL|nr:hypothetical protein [Saccharibacillus kuerlensis]GGO08214.1 hypothetical protein GCM10010969_37460 [Saccharibacillus kuerlensis]
MRRSMQIVLAFILLLMPINMLLPSEKALACSCIIPESAEKAKEQAAAVFTGTVRSIGEFESDRKEKYYAVTLAVDESWKGVNESEIVVYTRWSSCQFDFEKGKRYLLYSYENDGRYEVVNCGRSGEIHQENAGAAADLEELGAGTKFEAPPESGGEADRGIDGGTVIRWIAISVVALVLAAALGLWLRHKRKKGSF